MCTLTYIPFKNGFFFTTNRDEGYSREEALPPNVYEEFGHTVIYAKDPEGGGTWIASNKYRAICLLNGAFVPHERNPPYRKSRGLVLLDLFKYPNIEKFSHSENLEGIEPFTVVVANVYSSYVKELRWDGVKTHIYKYSKTDPLIWMSAPLYSYEQQQWRTKYFKEFVMKKPLSQLVQSDIFNFHSYYNPENPDQSILLNKENVIGTVSISSVKLDKNEMEFNYLDIKNGNEHFCKLP